MKKILNYALSDKKLIKDNLILFGSMLILNVLSYFFHFYAGRTLGPIQYGIFGSLLSLIYIMVIPFTTIQTGIAKFVSEFKAKKQFGKIHYLLNRSLKKMLLFAIVAVIIFFILTPFIARFLKLTDLNPLYLLSIFLFFSLLFPLTRGMLQGLQKFKALGASFILEGISKLGFGVLLITLGFGVSGAVGAFALAYIFPFTISFFGLKEVYKYKKEKFKTKEVYNYSWPLLFMLISLTAFYTIDILLVKHYLSGLDAGYYAALSLLGKIILFGTLSISMVMFPKVSELQTLKGKHKDLLHKSSLFVLIFGGVVTLFYFLIPKFTINILFGQAYLEIAPLLGVYGIVMTLFSLIYVMSFYKISLKQTNFLYLLGLFNVLEALVIVFFHNSLIQIVYGLLFLMIALFILLSYNYFPERKWTYQL